MARRFDPNVGSWDGYQEDLEAAWDALDRDLVTPQGSAVDPVPDLLQLALVRGTLSSADDLPRALVAAAIRTGAWTVERAASTIGRHPSPDHRVMMLCDVLRTLRLNRDLRRTIVSQVVELAQLPARHLPAEALMCGVEVLGPAERVVVADRIASDAVVFNDRHTERQFSGSEISSASAIKTFEAVPEFRRPVLIKKVADALLRELSPPDPNTSRDHPPVEATPGRLKPLMEQQYEDMVNDFFDPRRARDDAAALLVRLASFLPAHPDPRRFLDQLARVIPYVPDNAIRS